MSLVLGKNGSNELKEINLTNSGLLKIDLAGSSGGAIEANVDITANSIGLSTSALQTSGNASLTTIAGDTTSMDGKITACNTGAVVVSSSALPTGAATDAVLQSADSYLGTIATDTNDMNIKMTQGYDAQIASGGSGLQQNLMYGRDASGNLDALLVNASGELKVASTASGATTTNVNDVLAPGAGGTATSTAVDMDGFTNVSFFGSTTNTSDQIVVQVSHNNSTWVENTEAYINLSATGGEFFVNVPNTGARYYRVQQVDTLTTAFTLTVNSSKK